MEAFSDPEVMAALQDGNLFHIIDFLHFFRLFCNVVLCCNMGNVLFWRKFAVMKNPANLAKHQSNPKVAPTIAKMMGKFSAPK